jgi:hypothetical protein
MVFVLSLAVVQECRAQGDTLKPVPDEIRFEACLPNQNDIGRPLPLAAHWNTGQLPTGFTPDYQMQMIDKGHYILPAFYLPYPWENPGDAYYEGAIKKAAALNLPISFVGTQWESLLTIDSAYFDLPADRNPNVIGLDGSVQQEVDPFGPYDPWTEVGQRWTSSPEMQKLRHWYPGPPLVVFVSNNEAGKLQWSDAEMSKRYAALYGLGKDDNFKRQVVGDGWIARYRALQGGMIEGLGLQGQWSQNAKFVGYGAFGTRTFGRRPNWIQSSLYVPGRMTPWPLAWDGVSESYGLDASGIADYQVYSPEIESMNWIFMLKDAYRLNPGFWFEITSWDGDSQERGYFASRGQTYTPERYGGMVRFGMWLLRPRVVREFRMWDDTVANAEPYFLAVTGAVDSVHRDPLLRKFWRNADLVPNHACQHPYQSNIPVEYQSVDRWFLLDTSLDPRRPWQLTAMLPVFSLALVLGQSPEREWLVYAYSPLGPQQKVQVTLPGYGQITLDASPSGTYWHVIEKTKEVDPVVPGPPASG